MTDFTPLSDDELAELTAEHYPETYPEKIDGRPIVRVKCHALSNDDCAWHDGWPCRVVRLIAMVEFRRRLLAEALTYLEDVQDFGPEGEGWKSDELLKLITDIEAVLKQ